MGVALRLGLPAEQLAVEARRGARVWKGARESAGHAVLVAVALAHACLESH